MKFYLAINGQPEGPFDHHQLLAHGLTATSLVWTEGMSSWEQAQKVPELAELLFGGGMATEQPACPTEGTGAPDVPPYPPNGQQQPPYGQQQPPYGQQQPPYGQQQPPYGQQQPPYGSMGICPKTWLVESILVTIFCCLPFGIVGIVKASQVESLWRQGRMQEAQQASLAAGRWTAVSFWVGLGLMVLYWIAVFAGGLLPFVFL